jgi:hypothetical protein
MLSFSDSLVPMALLLHGLGSEATPEKAPSKGWAPVRLVRQQTILRVACRAVGQDVTELRQQLSLGLAR